MSGEKCFALFLGMTLGGALVHSFVGDWAAFAHAEYWIVATLLAAWWVGMGRAKR